MTPTPSQINAHKVVSRAITMGRKAFFGQENAHIPVAENPTLAADDKLLQPGFVGSMYKPGELLIVGINPGNGSRIRRSGADQEMMPTLEKFNHSLELNDFLRAMAAQEAAFPTWMASADLTPMLNELGITTKDISYFNALPYRVAGNSAQSAFPNLSRKSAAALSWVTPMINALQPGVILAHGRKASDVLDLALLRYETPVRLVFDRERVASRRNAKNAGLKAQLANELGALKF